MFLYGKIISSGKGIKKDYDPLCGHLLLDGARMRPFSCEKRNGGLWNGLFMTPYLLFIFLWRDTDYAN